MQRLILGAALVLATAGLPVAHAQQTAGEVYQWTDAGGVTHYSQTPPARGAYQQRVITHSGSAAPAAGTATVDAAQNPQCVVARNNIAALETGRTVGQDADGDGKPDQVMTDDQRAAQLDLARAAVKAYCTS